MELALTDFEIYRISLLVFGIVAFIICFWLWTVNTENVQLREKLARVSFAGLILAFFDLLWCIPHAKPLLPASLHQYLLPTVFICTFLSWAFLDYLFARAIGGFMILLAYYFLHASFTFHTVAAPVFSIFCFAMGIAGIFFSGKPYLFRDMFRKLASSKNFKISVVAFLFVFSLFSLIAGIMHMLPGKV